MTEKQECRDEGETKEAREGGTRKDPEMGVRETKGRSRGDPGKIHRSWGSVFRSVGGSIGKGARREGVGAGDKVVRARGGLGGGGGEDETRTIESGGVLGSQVRSVEGRWMSSGER